MKRGDNVPNRKEQGPGVVAAHFIHPGETYTYQSNRLVVKTAGQVGQQFVVTGDLYDPSGRLLGPVTVHADAKWNLPFEWAK